MPLSLLGLGDYVVSSVDCVQSYLMSLVKN